MQRRCFAAVARARRYACQVPALRTPTRRLLVPPRRVVDQVADAVDLVLDRVADDALEVLRAASRRGSRSRSPRPTVAISRNRNISAMKRVNAPAPAARLGLGTRRAALRRRAARGDGRAAPGAGARLRQRRRDRAAARSSQRPASLAEATRVAAVSSSIVAAESRPRAPARSASPNSAALAYRCSGRGRERPGHRAAQLGGHLRVQQVQRLGLALLLAQRQLGQRAGLVRNPAGEQLVQDDAQRVDVGARPSPPRRARARARGRRRCRAPSRSG